MTIILMLVILWFLIRDSLRTKEVRLSSSLIWLLRFLGDLGMKNTLETLSFTLVYDLSLENSRRGHSSYKKRERNYLEKSTCNETMSYRPSITSPLEDMYFKLWPWWSLYQVNPMDREITSPLDIHLCHRPMIQSISTTRRNRDLPLLEFRKPTHP